MSDIRHYSTHPEEHTNDSFEANLEHWISQYNKKNNTASKNTDDSFEANLNNWIYQYKNKKTRNHHQQAGK
jgi:hypothetical protein